jgi:hypothetical protein
LGNKDTVQIGKTKKKNQSILSKNSTRFTPKDILSAENRIKIENDPDPSDVILTRFEQHGNITPHLPNLTISFVP